MVEGEWLHLQDYSSMFLFCFLPINTLRIIVLLLREMLDGFNFHARVHWHSAQRGSCHSLYAANVLLSVYWRDTSAEMLH